jgi:hypothetical protein
VKLFVHGLAQHLQDRSSDEVFECSPGVQFTVTEYIRLSKKYTVKENAPVQAHFMGSKIKSEQSFRSQFRDSSLRR